MLTLGVVLKYTAEGARTEQRDHLGASGEREVLGMMEIMVTLVTAFLGGGGHTHGK